MLSLDIWSKYVKYITKQEVLIERIWHTGWIFSDKALATPSPPK